MPSRRRSGRMRHILENTDQAREAREAHEARSAEVNPADQEAPLIDQCTKCLLVPHILNDINRWIILHAAETGSYSINGTSTVTYAEYHNYGEIPRFRNRKSNTIITRPFMQSAVEWTVSGYFDIPATECLSTCITIDAHFVLGISRDNSRALANTLQTLWTYIRDLPLEGQAQLGWREIIQSEGRRGVRLLIAIGAYRPTPWLPQAAIHCRLTTDGPQEETRRGQAINTFIAPHATPSSS